MLKRHNPAPPPPPSSSPGRTLSRLSERHGGVDLHFQSERLDKSSMTHAVFQHCTFEDISFKGARTEASVFLDCTFIRCYFRDASFYRCDFTAARFIDCRFSTGLRLKDVELQYVEFFGCHLPAEVVKAELPLHSNQREAIASNLAVQAENAGRSREARSFRLIAIDAERQHHWRAFAHADGYYKKYTGLTRLKHGAQWLALGLFNVIWGNGERGARLALSVLIFTLVLFPALYVRIDGLTIANTANPSFWDAVKVSCSQMLNLNSIDSSMFSTTSIQWLAIVESAVGFLFLGLGVSFLLRWVFRR